MGHSTTGSPSFLGVSESIGARLPLLLLAAIGPAVIGPDTGSQVDKNGCDIVTRLVEWPYRVIVKNHILSPALEKMQ